MQAIKVILAVSACVICNGAFAQSVDIKPAPARLATPNPQAEALVRSFVAAYNTKDLEGMMSRVSDDITWLSIEGDKSSVVTQGADALRAEMKGYLGRDATPKSDIEILSSHGNFVTTLERAYWTVNGEEKSQASFAVYEVVNRDRDLAIKRIWYFPAQP